MMKQQADPAFWALVDFFRTESPRGWAPDCFEFKKGSKTARCGGRTWGVSYGIRAIPSEKPQAIVSLVSQGARTRNLTPHQRLMEFTALEAIERVMRRAQYVGSFESTYPDEIVGNFSKSLTRADAVRREVGWLASLRLTSDSLLPGARSPRVGGRQ